MKKILLILAVIFASQALYAQSFEEYKKQINKEYKEFKSQRDKEYTEYRNKINSEFADFMRGKWEKKEAKPAVPAPIEPEPPKPAIADPKDVPPAPTPIIFDKVIERNPIVPQPSPYVPIPDYRREDVDPLPEEEDEKVLPPRPRPELNPNKPQPDFPDAPMPDIDVDDTPQRKDEPAPKPELQPQPKPEPVVEDFPLPKNAFKFNYYGTKCGVSLTNSLKYTLKGSDENAVANAWVELSSEKYNALLNDCLAWRNKLQLCDWGYFRFVEDMSEAFFGKSKKNEARVMQMYILTQSGYQVRMARTGSTIVLAIPFESDVYRYNYLTISGTKFYIVDSSLKGSNQFYIFNRAFPNEQSFYLTSAKEPIFAETKNATRNRSFDGFGSSPVKFTVNGNLMDFYNDFPRTNDWNIYALRSLSSKVKSTLYPKLKAAISGKSETEAANILLSFVQHAFDYKTDEQQFGYERSLFADETFYYPYSDCEDRSILYSVLMRDLVGLEIVLVHYSGHLATAVKFSSSVNGDYFNLDDGKYTVCDPTYIGASIGQAMPQYKTASATIIRI